MTARAATTRRAVWAAGLALATLCLTRGAAAQDSDGDDVVVEVIEDDDGKPGDKGPSRGGASKRPPPPKEEEEKRDSLKLRGFARSLVVGGIEGDPLAPASAPLEERVPYERGALMQQVYAEVSYARGDSLRAVLSGSLAYSLRVTEGSALSPGPAREVKSGKLEPVLREAYVGYFWPHADIRIGQQRIVWGNSDAITPNDVLNARDLRTRTLLDTEMVALPTLAARGNVELGRLTLGLVAQPFFVPDKTSLYGASWAIMQPDAPRVHRRIFGLYARDGGDVNVDDAPTGLVDSRAPTKFLEGASVGVSAKVNLGGADFSWYYHWGLDRTPFVYLDPQFAAGIERAQPGEINGVVIDALLAQRKEAQNLYGGPFLLQYARRHHVGFDASTTAGPFVLRTDVAFDSASTFFSRRTFNSIARPTAQAVVGVEYQGGADRVIAIEGWYMRLFDQEVPVVPVLNQANSGPVLFADQNNVGVAAAARIGLSGGFLIETRGFVGAAPRWFMVRPEIGWASASFTVRAGAILVDGEAGSTGGHYRRNDNVYLTARYSF